MQWLYAIFAAVVAVLFGAFKNEQSKRKNAEVEVEVVKAKEGDAALKQKQDDVRSGIKTKVDDKPLSDKELEDYWNKK